MGINLAYYDHFISNLIRFIPLDYGIIVIDIISFKRPEFISGLFFVLHASLNVSIIFS